MTQPDDARGRTDRAEAGHGCGAGAELAGSSGLSCQWLASELAKLRSESGLSQTAAAGALGWRTPKLSLFERAERVIDDDDLQALLALYGVAETEWLDYLVAAARARAERLVAKEVQGAQYDALCQVAHQLCGVLWAHQRTAAPTDVAVALQVERETVRARLRAIQPDTPTVGVVLREWGARVRDLRETAPEKGQRDLCPPETVLEDIFQEAIVNDLLSGGTIGERRPHAVLLVGQPGAGAAVAQAELVAEFAGKGGIVPVALDELGGYHPDYLWLLAEHPCELVDVTDPAARWWQARLVECLQNRLCHLLVDDTNTPANEGLARAESLAADGYHVRLIVLAAPAAVSQLTVIESYRHQCDAAGTGHWVSAAQHHAGHASTTDAVALASHSDAVAEITIRSRIIPKAGHVLDLRPAGHGRARHPSLLEQLNDARDALNPAGHTAFADRVTHTLSNLADAGLIERPIYGPNHTQPTRSSSEPSTPKPRRA